MTAPPLPPSLDRPTARHRSTLVRWLHALQLYGAAAITAFGIGVCALLDWPCAAWWPLWLAGALLAYNLDRLKDDPVDAVNVPARWAATRRWRRWHAAVVALAALGLLGQPAWRRDWLTLGCVLGGSASCLAYSLPGAGRRLKDVPALKTFIPPTVVAAAIFALPLAHGAPPPDARALAGAIGWVWMYLFANMLLCDLRDLDGDQAVGTRSLPVLLGAAGTQRLLGALMMGGAISASVVAVFGPHRGAWLVLAAASVAVLAWLRRQVGEPQPERFYEWWVEGMFFLPAFVAGAARFFSA